MLNFTAYGNILRLFEEVLVYEPVEVLTPPAAAFLFRRSGEAVRTASRKGRVKTELVVDFEGRPVRLLTLESARHYWSASLLPDYEQQLQKMRERATILDLSGRHYLVLHPWELVKFHPDCPHGNRWPCDEPPCSVTWFKEN